MFPERDLKWRGELSPPLGYWICGDECRVGVLVLADVFHGGAEQFAVTVDGVAADVAQTEPFEHPSRWSCSYVSMSLLATAMTDAIRFIAPPRPGIGAR